MKMKISNFFKTLFFNITLTFIDDSTLNIDDQRFLKFWTFVAFAGLHWPFWPLWAWMNL
jgi:hypothetical protein